MTSDRRAVIWLAIIVGLGFVLYGLRDMMIPFVAGMAVAYFLDPIADRLEAMGLSRTAATTLITAVFFLVMIGGVMLLLPVLQGQISGFISRAPVYSDALRQWAEPWIQQILAGLGEDEVKRLAKEASAYAGQVAGWLGTTVRRLLSGSLAIVQVVSILVITPLVSFYLLRDWDVMVGRIDSWLPRHQADVIRAQFRLIDQTLAGFVRGQATVCFLLAVFYGTSLSVLGLEFGLLLGLGAGMISFIPYFGAAVGFGSSMAIAVAQFDNTTSIALVGAVFVIGQVVEGNFLTPKLVGERVGLHPVWVIFALMAGGSLFGFTGVMLAVPVAAVIGVGTRFAIGRYLESRLYLGNETSYQGRTDDHS